MENIWLIKLIFQKGKYHKKDTCLFVTFAYHKKLSMMGTAALDHIFTGMAGEKVLHTRSREYVVDEIWK